MTELPTVEVLQSLTTHHLCSFLPIKGVEAAKEHLECVTLVKNKGPAERQMKVDA